jgi:enoyl-CoA hydratase
VKQEIIDHVGSFARDEAVAVIVLTGEGGCFVAGTDIAEMAQMSPTDHVRLETDRVFHVLRQCPKPVIAAVEGYALGGGCELALACDMIVAADDAQFGQPEIRVGIMPGAGGTQRLLRTAGRYKTLLWCLTGQMIPAREAHAANLVSELAPKGQALARGVEIAGQIASMPPLAVQAIREAARLGADVPLETGLALERRLFERLFDSQDQKEGMRAFMEKRKPMWQGR